MKADGERAVEDLVSLIYVLECCIGSRVSGVLVGVVPESILKLEDDRWQAKVQELVALSRNLEIRFLDMFGIRTAGYSEPLVEIF